MKVVCDKCKYEGEFKDFLENTKYKSENDVNYSKEEYKCPNCGHTDESDWLIDG